MLNNVIVEVEATNDYASTLLYSGSAEFQQKEDVITLKYKDSQDVMNRVRFSPNGCILLRKGEDEIKVHLSIDRESYIEVKTNIGSLRFPVDTEVIYSQKDYMRVKYSIPDSYDNDAQFEFTWKITGNLS